MDKPDEEQQQMMDEAKGLISALQKLYATPDWRADPELVKVDEGIKERIAANFERARAYNEKHGI